LRSRGHEIDVCDLYVERFDPVMSEQERIQYHNVALTPAPIAGYPIGYWQPNRWSSSIRFGTRNFRLS
jgi:hypothetical protein